MGESGNNYEKIGSAKVHKCEVKTPGVTVQWTQLLLSDVCYVTSDILGQDRFRHTGHDHCKIDLARYRLLNIKFTASTAHDVPPWNSNLFE